jgi:hypothetical protein
MEIAKLIVDLLGKVIWPAVVVTIVLMFHKQIIARLKDIKELELPGGFKATLNEVKEIVSTSIELKEKQIEPQLTEDNFLISPPENIQVSVFNLRLSIEREVSRLIQISSAWERSDTRSLKAKVEILYKLGWLNRNVYEGLMSFVEMTNELFHVSGKSDKDLNDLFKIGSTLFYHIRYLKIVRELIDNFNGNLLWYTEKGVRNKKYHFYSAVASEAERFDYSYEAFVDAATKFNLRDPKVHNNWRPGGEILIPTLDEYIQILEFRKSELTRVLNNPQKAHQDQNFNEWQWPQDWQIQWNRPLMKDSFNETQLELIRTQAAIDLYRRKKITEL